jgi:Cu/Ag efflux pump CusA
MGGFLPFLVLTGGEFWPPLAVVIAGGVGFSVTLSLVFTPAIYRLLARRRLQSSPKPLAEDIQPLSVGPGLSGSSGL